MADALNQTRLKWLIRLKKISWQQLITDLGPKGIDWHCLADALNQKRLKRLIKGKKCTVLIAIPVAHLTLSLDADALVDAVPAVGSVVGRDQQLPLPCGAGAL